MIREVCALLFLCALSHSSNILFANTWHSKSHARTMMYMAERLVDRGHNVTMYSMVSQSIGKMGTKIHTLESVLPAHAYTQDQDLTERLFWEDEMEPLFFEVPYIIGLEYITHLVNDETFQNVLNTKFDLVIADELYASGQTALAMKLKEKFGTKVAIFCTTDLFASFSMKRGLGRNPVTYPNYYTKGYGMFNYKERHFGGRLLTIWDTILEQYVLGFPANAWVVEAGELLGVESSIYKLFDESTVSFIDYPSRYGSATPRSTDLVYVGEHCEAARPLPSRLLSFVEDPQSKGTIYVAFGSIVNWNSAPPGVIDTFATVLNNLTDYRVIWSYTGPKLNLSSHVRFSKWAPQNDILSHPKTVLFFTHGGLKSLKEGVCGGAPMLFLPFFADQIKNALYAMKMGIAEAVYKKNITVEELSTKMRRALEGNGKTKTRKFRSSFIDNIIDPRDLGVHWTNRVIKLQNDAKRYFAIKGRWLSWRSFGYIELISAGFVLLYALST